MECLVEHYTELYARENVVTEDALNAIECLPELEELDREPTIDELTKALDSLASGKAPGKDGIPAKVLKCCKETLITELHEILCLSEGIDLRTRTDGKLFNLSRLRAKTKVQLRCLHDFLFADDAAVTAHSAKDLQQLMNRFSDACQDFGLAISLKKTQGLSFPRKTG
ncbi:uncharacterized protein LOC143285577 [Babylonia areolata]|uniref:uncharacterized protein LOC143285577 n=1 Tax=Babylonia areolata TaxID=304850 RepID=UPI003FD215D9